MNKFICIIILLFAGFQSSAQKITLIERVLETKSAEKNPVIAKQQMINEATEKLSEDFIKEMIGEAKYARNKIIINNKVIKNAARFIPFTKPGEMKPTPEGGYSMAVILKINADDLQGLLLENGLLYESDSTPSVLPMVRFVDKVNTKTFSWWSESETPSKTFLIKEEKYLEEKLRDAFQKVNFYSLKPLTLKYYELLPASYRSETLRPEDQQRLSQTFQAPILLEGQVQLSKSPTRSEAQLIEIKLIATQVSSGRVIAEVSRQFETDMGNFESVVDRKLREVLEATTQDLANQLLDAWQKGSIGSTLYKLTVHGRLPLLQQEELKNTLKSKIREVKNIRERLISSDALVFEVDASIGPQELAKKAPQIDLQGIKLILESANEAGASYRTAKP